MLSPLSRCPLHEDHAIETCTSSLLSPADRARRGSAARRARADLALGRALVSPRQGRRRARAAVVACVSPGRPDARHREAPRASFSLRKTASKPIEGVPQVTVHGQGGLHDVVLHPDFKSNQLVYLAYAARAATASAPGSRAGGSRVSGSRTCRCFSAESQGGAGQHFGGRIVFDRQGYLYLTLGDRGERDRAASRRPRRFGDPAARRRARAEGQSLRRPEWLEAGEVHPRQPQHPGRRFIRRPGSCGHTSTARRAATRST